MGLLGIVFALFTLGYILGVWTGAMVFKQRQRAYEDPVPVVLVPRPLRPFGPPPRLAGRD